jgi:hypothetical protein
VHPVGLAQHQHAIGHPNSDKRAAMLRPRHEPPAP